MMNKSGQGGIADTLTRISVMRINILGSCDIEKRINWGLLGRMAS